MAQAAVEGALSSLANLADGCPEVRRAAGDAGAIELLVTCLQSAQNGASIIRQPANVRETEISVAKVNCLLFWDEFCLCMHLFTAGKKDRYPTALPIQSGGELLYCALCATAASAMQPVR